MLRFALVAVLGLIFAGPADAQNVTGANVLEQGVYSAHMIKDKDKNARTISSDYKLVKAGSTIESAAYEASQFEDGTPRVGFWWYLNGTPRGQQVQVRIVQKNPDGKTYDTPWTRKIGEKNWNGVRVGSWSGAVGKTVFTGWYGSRKLFEVSFDVK